MAINTQFKLSLFDASGLQNPERAGIQLLKSQNGFESPQRYWSLNSGRLTKERVYNGDFAEKAGEYSATFILPLDSIELPESGHIYIRCQLVTWFENSTSAELVASIEDSTGVLFRKAMPLNRFQKAFSNWWPAHFDLDVKREQIPPNSVLKIYLWNPEMTTAYIDDFSIEIRAIP